MGLRTLRAPDGTPAEAFDNLEVESAALADPTLPATVLRLPAIYGPGDRQHRLARYLHSMRDGRQAIVLGESDARWRWSRGYVENVAAAIALAVGDPRATGRIYKSALSQCSPKQNGFERADRECFVRGTAGRACGPRHRC